MILNYVLSAWQHIDVKTARYKNNEYMLGHELLVLIAQCMS